ncbi:MAG: sulfite exporter TauE/SafE family protein [candidate division KSB1 bacterium]|nr:sulfite exporter TauE/SafE family protein [candidate division KSB1 bacterium]MDZ7294435.1 sulfite exporter TauE/SafE family protein [candidate division KSB1 bacterium]MDZ7379077.1 sulfite exporter TauE/SafE family protein [candidate division KSB1 bacterium]MDZ7392991.1 sulfite exporter TauE/SafE family protein [candidate division KSB1 bacterium]MDZ7413503.1 sulfite exporter TauE/SafE family protein [candidate division KSB1 bacterium]
MNQDVLKEVLYYEQVSPLFLLGVLAVAFFLGALHALGPGHGKSLMAAYLVGSRGRGRDAVALALSLSLAHVLVVLVVALVALWVTDVFWPESVARWFALASGVAICGIGAWLLVVRVRSLVGRGPQGAAHAHEERHSHSHWLDSRGRHRNNAHPCREEVGGTLRPWATLWHAAALGFSSGVVPCPKALVILLLAVSLHRVALGLALVASFSVGMASVLVAIGLVMVKARHLVEHRLEARGVAYLSLAGALLIMGLGALVSYRSLVGS